MRLSGGVIGGRVAIRVGGNVTINANGPYVRRRAQIPGPTAGPGEGGNVMAGRGGPPQASDATLPALYIAGRDVNPDPQTDTDTTEASSALQTTVRLTMRCG